VKETKLIRVNYVIFCQFACSQQEKLVIDSKLCLSLFRSFIHSLLVECLFLSWSKSKTTFLPFFCFQKIFHSMLFRSSFIRHNGVLKRIGTSQCWLQRLISNDFCTLCRNLERFGSV